MDSDHLRNQLNNLLKWRDAHANFDRVLSDFPIGRINSRAPGIPYTPWQLLEHMRLAQWDILEFCINPNYSARNFPDDYWPDPSEPGDAQGWDRSVANFRKDLHVMLDLVTDPSNDLYAPIPHGDGQTLLREILLLADHNAYHLGQLVLLRRHLDAWPPQRTS